MRGASYKQEFIREMALCTNYIVQISVSSRDLPQEITENQLYLGLKGGLHWQETSMKIQCLKMHKLKKPQMTKLDEELKESPGKIHR